MTNILIAAVAANLVLWLLDRYRLQQTIDNHADLLAKFGVYVAASSSLLRAHQECIKANADRTGVDWQEYFED